MEKVGWATQMVPAEVILCSTLSHYIPLSNLAVSIQVIQWNTIEVVCDGHHIERPQVWEEGEL